MTRPLAFHWDGEAMIPLQPKLADREYVVGENYTLAPFEDRSAESHNHQFAWLHEAWMNLPERLAELYPSPAHLRKRALIEGGFYNETAIDAGTNAAALRVASAMRSLDDFALVFVRGCFVVHRTAKSQSRRAMKKDEFQDSKQKVLEIVADMIGVKPEELTKHNPSRSPAPQNNPKVAGRARGSVGDALTPATNHEAA